MLCNNCGKEIRDGAKFCNSCGAVQKNTDVSNETEVIQSEKPNKKPRNKICLAITIIIAIILTAACGFISVNAVINYAPYISVDYDYYNSTIHEKKQHLIDRGYALSDVDNSYWIHENRFEDDEIRIVNNLIEEFEISKVKNSSIPAVIVSCSFLWILAILIVISSKKVFSNVGHKKNTVYYCYKCKKETMHNKYKVCTECNSDSMHKSCLFITLIGYFIYSFYYILVSLIWSFSYRSIESVWGIIIYLLALGLTVLILLPLFIANIYMYPTKLARRNNHSAATAIMFLNIIFGATIILWIVLLIWASGNQNNKTVIVQQQPTQQKSIQDTFAELNKLKEQGLISDDEFEQKRKELISRI